MSAKASIWRRARWWQFRQRRKLATWLVEILCGEDMLWDVDDPEKPFDSVDEWAAEHWDWDPPAFDVVTQKFSRALSLPSKTYRVTRKTYEDSDDEDFIVTEQRP